MQELEIKPIEIEIEYKGKPEDKEEDIRRLKQELENRFNCPVRDYEPIDEKEEEFKRLHGCSILEYMFRLGKG